MPTVTVLDRHSLRRPKSNEPRLFGFAEVERAAVGDGEAITTREVGLLLGVDGTQVTRWRLSGLTLDQADVLAFRIGRHPGELWPSWWEEEATS